MLLHGVSRSLFSCGRLVRWCCRKGGEANHVMSLPVLPQHFHSLCCNRHFLYLRVSLSPISLLPFPFGKNAHVTVAC